MKRLANGISNFQELIEGTYFYVDKTQFIEKLEGLTDKRIMYLRPRKFGKTLFTSTLQYYYDINEKDKFEKLFCNTYIGKNPTAQRNSYHILRFNFSGIDTKNEESTINGFKNKVILGIENFIGTYGLDFYINKDDEAENLLSNIFLAFQLQKNNEKIYVIIDEYDHFANELLSFQTENFKSLLSKNGKVRKWYEILKEGTETVVDRIFITGVAPITLDSTTSGFNIARDLTKEIKFNNMLGFTKEEVKQIMTEIEIDEKTQKELMPIIKQNYDGYVFTDMLEENVENIENYKMYNSNMTLYFLNAYKEQNKVPQKLTDVNIISDYRKLEGFINLCKTKGKMNLLEKIVAEEEIYSELTEKFNSEVIFNEKELISLLYYLGYLTISGKGYSKCKFKVPNDVIRKIYTDYYLTYISEQAKIEADLIDTENINHEILEEGKIDKIMQLLGNYLQNLSNRDYSRFDEKYVKLIFYTLSRMLGTMVVKSELEVTEGYSDILLIPREKINERYSILVEFKYIKKEDYEKDKGLLEKKQEEAKEQIEKCKQSEEIKLLLKLKCYTVVVIKDKIYKEEIL